MDSSPVEGLLHKYQMSLLHTISTCSAYCRSCYREKFIARKDNERQDGTVEKKGISHVKEATDYMRAYNAAVEANGGTHPDTGGYVDDGTGCARMRVGASTTYPLDL